MISHKLFLITLMNLDIYWDIEVGVCCIYVSYYLVLGDIPVDQTV